MKIVIAGAGAVGFQLAQLLARENQEITLIDTDPDVLRHVDRYLDVLTIKGDAANMQLLDEVNMKKTNLFIAVTTSEKTNLLASILAKQLGAQKTVARISNLNHLQQACVQKFNDLGIDELISPEHLASLEIERLLSRASFTDLFEFGNGQMTVVGFTIDAFSPLINKSIEQIDNETDYFNFQGIALLRGHRTIIPNGSTRLRKGDHLYIATQKKNIESVIGFVGKRMRPIRNVMIIGGTALSLRAAQALEKKYSVSVVLKDEEGAKTFVSELENALVIHADPSDADALKECGLSKMDAFIALTKNSETNILSSLLAEEEGVLKTIALVENVNYTYISQNIGIDTIINQKLLAANDIFRYVRKGKVEAIASLHGVDAEIIEFVIHKNNRVVKQPLKDLRLPKKSIIAGVVRGEQGIVPKGDFTLEIEDKVIVFALPEAISKIEEIFR